MEVQNFNLSAYEIYSCKDNGPMDWHMMDLSKPIIES